MEGVGRTTRQRNTHTHTLSAAHSSHRAYTPHADATSLAYPSSINRSTLHRSIGHVAPSRPQSLGFIWSWSTALDTGTAFQSNSGTLPNRTFIPPVHSQNSFQHFLFLYHLHFILSLTLAPPSAYSALPFTTLLNPVWHSYCGEPPLPFFFVKKAESHCWHSWNREEAHFGSICYPYHRRHHKPPHTQRPSCLHYTLLGLCCLPSVTSSPPKTMSMLAAAASSSILSSITSRPVLACLFASPLAMLRHTASTAWSLATRAP